MLTPYFEVYVHVPDLIYFFTKITDQFDDVFFVFPICFVGTFLLKRHSSPSIHHTHPCPIAGAPAHGEHGTTGREGLRVD